MTIIELTPAPAEPLTLAEAKDWCRIERGDEDALIALLVSSARQAAEAETGLTLARRDFRLALDPVPPDGWLRLPRLPMGAVTAVTAYGAGGTPTAFAPEAAIAERAGPEAIRLAGSVCEAGANGVEIEFTAGFAAGTAPPMLLHAMRMIVAAAYELRGAIGPEAQPGVVPAAARALMAPYRRVRL